jgi:glycosyltransferase involved in cell wall biosynthesis
MACGTPVIVADASSLPEVASGAGLLVPPHETSAWAEALRLAYSSSAWRAQASQQGMKDVQRFTWLHTARQTLRSYECSLNIRKS